jgi:HAD superfamily hydrolase (TIGR01509 family)
MGEREMVYLLCGQSTPALPAERVWAEYRNKTEQFRKDALEVELIGSAVRDLLNELRSYRLAVVSSSARAEVEPLLIAGGIRDRFSALVCGEDVERLKPAPDPYLRGAALIAGRRPLVVEDSETGAASGRAAGFEVLQIPSCEQMPELLRLRLGAGGLTG